MARDVLAECLLASGRAAPAELEWRAARASFERLGARRDGARVAARFRELSARPATRADLASGPVATATSGGPSPIPTAAVFRCDGDTRTIAFGDRTVLVRDLEGMRYLARLLGAPGGEFHALDLVAHTHGTLRSSIPAVEVPVGQGDAGPLLTRWHVTPTDDGSLTSKVLGGATTSSVSPWPSGTVTTWWESSVGRSDSAVARDAPVTTRSALVPASHDPTAYAEVAAIRDRWGARVAAGDIEGRCASSWTTTAGGCGPLSPLAHPREVALALASHVPGDATEGHGDRRASGYW